MLATLTLDQKKDASFVHALNALKGRLQSRPIPYSRTCAACSKPIFSADTTATEQGGEWTHAGCEPVISGAETNGDDSHDPRLDEPPTEHELNESYLAATGWECVSNGDDPHDSVWRDALSGGFFFFDHALTRQSERDATGWSFAD